MDSLVINTIIGFWLVLFGAMAILPFMLEGKTARRTPIDVQDDVVISIQPVRTPHTTVHPITPLVMPTPEPDQREAA